MNQNEYVNYEELESGTTINMVAQQSAYAALFRKVYVWMTLALAVSGLTAYYVYLHLGTLSQGAFWGCAIAELVLVLVLSGAINRLSFATAGMLFIGYSVLNGVTLSVFFMAYTQASIATAFFVTAGTFGAMSLVGYFTKKDLSSMGRILFMALIGLIIASLVNLFMQSTVLYWITSYVGVLVFVGLTAWDTQKIKHMFQAYGHEVNSETQKLALLGSLTLYLDFVNLFIYLLRIFGDRK